MTDQLKTVASLTTLIAKWLNPDAWNTQGTLGDILGSVIQQRCSIATARSLVVALKRGGYLRSVGSASSGLLQIVSELDEEEDGTRYVYISVIESAKRPQHDILQLGTTYNNLRDAKNALVNDSRVVGVIKVPVVARFDIEINRPYTT